MTEQTAYRIALVIYAIVCVSLIGSFLFAGEPGGVFFWIVLVQTMGGILISLRLLSRSKDG